MADVSEKKTVGCPPPSWGSADKTHHTHTHTHTHTTKALTCQALSGRSCGRRRDRLQVVVSEAPGIPTLTGGHTPHLKGQLVRLCGEEFRGARRALQAPAPEGARVDCREERRGA